MLYEILMTLLASALMQASFLIFSVLFTATGT